MGFRSFLGFKSSDSNPAPEGKKIASFDQAKYQKTERADHIQALFQGRPSMANAAQVIDRIMGSLELVSEVADFILVLDGSGSMSDEYDKGLVQDIVDRATVLGIQFDDNESISVYGYASRPGRLPELTTANYADYIKSVRARSGGIFPGLGWDNDEPLVMEMLINDVKEKLALGGKVRPRYVFFLTDGGIDHRKSRLIEKLIIESSELPIFWQFVGLGQQDYGALQRFDDLSGRKIDNSDFFVIDDYKTVSLEQFFGLMLTEYPGWQRSAKAARII